MALTFSGLGTLTVTFQLLEPETATFRLYRSLQESPAESVAVQPPPVPPPPVPPPPVEEPRVMLELPLLW